MRTIADYRQLNDALFHAGLNSGSQFEYQDLHFYVVSVDQNRDGILTYTLAVGSLDGSGADKGRGINLAFSQHQGCPSEGLRKVEKHYKSDTSKQRLYLKQVQ